MKTLQIRFSNETHIEKPDTPSSTSSSSSLSPEDTLEHTGGKSCPPPNTLIGPGRGPSVFVSRSPYFLWLYKEVHNLADFALRNKFEVSHITPPVSCILKYIPFEKSELEHLKTQIESVVRDEYIPSDVAHDLAETSEDEDEDVEVQINIKKTRTIQNTSYPKCYTTHSFRTREMYRRILCWRRLFFTHTC